MGIEPNPGLPEVDPGPTTSQLLHEIFAEAERQGIKLVDMSRSLDWDIQKLNRVKRHSYEPPKRNSYIPKMDEYAALCLAVGRSPRQIEDAARFNSSSHPLRTIITV